MHNDGALRADFWLLLVTVLAAFGWVFSSMALDGMAPLLFMAGRFLMAGLVLTLAGWRSLKALSRQSWRYSLVTGAVMGLAMAFWINGLARADNMGIGAFLTSLGVVFVPIVGRLFFGASTSTSTWLAVAVALLGLALLRLEGGFALSLSDAFFLGAALVFSLHFNLNSRLARHIPALPLTTIQLLVTGALCLLLSLLVEPRPLWPKASILAWLLASALIATCLRFWLQIKAQGLANVSHAAVIMTLEPVWTALFGLIWFAQYLSLLQLLGCLLIFSALLISRWRLLLRRPRPTEIAS